MSHAATTVGSRISRLLSLIPFLVRHQGIGLAELSERVGAPTDVLLADLQTIMMCGVPPYGPGDFVGVYVEGDSVHLQFADHFERPIDWTLPEALALQIALEVFPAARGPFRDEARRLTGRIAAAFRTGGDDPLDPPPVVEGPGAPGDDVLAAVREALPDGRRAGRRLELDYCAVTRDERTIREVSPLALFEDDGAWYLAAWCHRRDDRRTFRLDRIRRATVLDRQAAADRSAATDPVALRDSFDRWRTGPGTTVRIRFDRTVEAYLGDAFPGARLEDGPDEATVDLVLSTHGLTWLVPRLLPFGTAARILEPDALVDEVARTGRAILDAYRDR